MVGERCGRWVRQRFVVRLASLVRMNARMSSAADSGHREHQDRSIVNAPIGHRERSAATLA